MTTTTTEPRPWKTIRDAWRASWAVTLTFAVAPHEPRPPWRFPELARPTIGAAGFTLDDVRFTGGTFGLVLSTTSQPMQQVQEALRKLVASLHADFGVELLGVRVQDRALATVARRLADGIGEQTNVT